MQASEDFRISAQGGSGSAWTKVLVIVNRDSNIINTSSRIDPFSGSTYHSPVASSTESGSTVYVLSPEVSRSPSLNLHT
jgi:hypothetical protein